uniref:Uncharacterized protein n=1 Tax=Trichogramma kaykai TaxID=54128 RepID=A0ABD2WKC8_9HYME
MRLDPEVQRAEELAAQHPELYQQQQQQRMVRLRPERFMQEDHLTHPEREWLDFHFGGADVARDKHSIIVTPLQLVGTVAMEDDVTQYECVELLRDLAARKHNTFDMSTRSILLQFAAFQPKIFRAVQPENSPANSSLGLSMDCWVKYYAFKPDHDTEYEGVVKNLSPTSIGLKMRNVTGLYVNIERDCNKHQDERTKKKCCRVTKDEIIKFKFVKFGVHPHSVFIYGNMHCCFLCTDNSADATAIHWFTSVLYQVNPKEYLPLRLAC